MSQTASTLLLRNLNDVFGEIDPERRRAVSGSPGKPPAYAGTDFIIVRDDRIAAVYLFFDKFPN